MSADGKSNSDGDIVLKGVSSPDEYGETEDQR